VQVHTPALLVVRLVGTVAGRAEGALAGASAAVGTQHRAEHKARTDIGTVWLLLGMVAVHVAVGRQQGVHGCWRC
jgi:hypothetical protein